MLKIKSITLPSAGLSSGGLSSAGLSSAGAFYFSDKFWILIWLVLKKLKFSI